MYNEKKIKRNIVKLKFAILRSSDIDFTILYLCVLEEYSHRKDKIDNLINDIKDVM